MTTQERVALMKFLEFRLFDLAETLQEDMDGMLQHRLAEEIVNVLEDVEDNLILLQEMTLNDFIGKSLN